jgi:hypothetical protein
VNVQNFVTTWDTWQWRYHLWWWYGLIVLELIDVVLKARGVPVRLMSQIVRDHAFDGFTAIAFATAGMAFHWNVTWHRLPWTGTTELVLALVFWFICGAYVAASYLDPSSRYWPTWALWVRYPPYAAALGALTAWLCFPQRSRWVPWEVLS